MNEAQAPARDLRESPRAEPSQMDVWTESRPRIGSETLATGKKVYFLSMDGADHHRMVLHNAQNPGNPMADAEIVAMCACNADGTKLWKEVSHGIGFLQGRDSVDLRNTAVAILRHSMIPISDTEAQELEKKS